MKRVDIIVEGQSERDFVKEVLAPYLYDNGIKVVSPITIRTSTTERGGFAKYSHLRDDIRRTLSSKDPELVVTTFFDFFRLPSNIPEKEAWESISDHFLKAEAIENAISRDINDSRFSPYLQMHEFEALLFSSNVGFGKFWSNDVASCTQKIIDAFNTPEEINTSPSGAPSKRLQAIIPNYDKVLYGNCIALEIGISTIMSKCPRFSMWVQSIIEKINRQ